MVQNMGNTLQAEVALRDVVDAVERDPEDGPTNRVCDQVDELCELS